MHLWRLLPFRLADAAENMAVDEAVFRESTRTKVSPTLRFYGWLRPTVSIGHFQNARREIDIEACRRLGIDIVRRPTGGRAVLHERELTYSVIAAADLPLFPPDILETFRIINSCIAAGLAACGIKAEMKAIGRAADKPREVSCFSFPSRYELIVGGRKICGSAQMRCRSVFLQHGALLTAFDPARTCAVMLPRRDREMRARRLKDSVTAVGEHADPAVNEERLCRALQEGFEQVLGVRFEEGRLTQEEEALKAELIADKYGSEEWNLEGRTL